MIAYKILTIYFLEISFVGIVNIPLLIDIQICVIFLIFP